MLPLESCHIKDVPFWVLLTFKKEIKWIEFKVNIAVKFENFYRKKRICNVENHDEGIKFKRVDKYFWHKSVVSSPCTNYKALNSSITYAFKSHIHRYCEFVTDA